MKRIFYLSGTLFFLSLTLLVGCAHIGQAQTEVIEKRFGTVRKDNGSISVASRKGGYLKGVQVHAVDEYSINSVLLFLNPGEARSLATWLVQAADDYDQ